MKKEKASDKEAGKYWGLRTMTHDGYDEAAAHPWKDRLEDELPFVYEHDT